MTEIQDLQLEEAISRYMSQLADTRSPATVTTYRSILRRWLRLAKRRAKTVGDLNDEMAPLLRQEVELVTRGGSDERGHPPSPRTLRLWAAAMSGFWAYLEDCGAENISLVRARKALEVARSQRLPSDLPEDVIEVAVQIADEDVRAMDRPDQEAGIRDWDAYLAAFRDLALVQVLYWTGMRISEALALKRGHLNWRAKPAYAVVAGKGSKERYVFFSPVAVRALRQYFRERDRAPGAGQANPDQPLLAGHGNRNRGGHITATSAWLVVRRLGDRALQRLIDEDADAESVWRTLHPHDFRHAALTRLWEQSSDLRFVQEIAGHASSSTTAGYTHPSAQALGERYLQTLSVEDEEEG